MKTKSVISTLKLLVALIGITLATTSVAPNPADAKPRSETSQPLPGDPDGPEQSPVPTIQKSSAVAPGVGGQRERIRTLSLRSFLIYLRVARLSRFI